MLNERLTKYGKNKKHPILIALKKWYSNKNIKCYWCDEKLLVDKIGWFFTETGNNRFPYLRVCFTYFNKPYNFSIQANTLQKLLLKLDYHFPELLFKNS